MRLAPLLAILLVVPGALGGLADTKATDTTPGTDAGVERWCNGAALGEDPLELSCPSAQIRPGANVGCTMNFVLANETSLFAVMAGHCAGEGGRLTVPGLGAVGTTVVAETDYSQFLEFRDWALVELDEDAREHVNPTMSRWGGPVAPVEDAGARPVAPGETVAYYGHGAGLGQEDATKGRLGEVLAVTPTSILFAGEVGAGDSGAPVRAASGQAVGIAVAIYGERVDDNQGVLDENCVQVSTLAGDDVNPCAPVAEACAALEGACRAPLHGGARYGAVVATRLDAAIDAFEQRLDTELWVMDGLASDGPAIAG
jgi:hypothetical protein